MKNAIAITAQTDMAVTEVMNVFIRLSEHIVSITDSGDFKDPDRYHIFGTTENGTALCRELENVKNLRQVTF